MLSKEKLLERLPAGPMREAHRSRTLSFVAESVVKWEAADEETKKDILAFFESDGPAKFAKARRRLGWERRGLN